MLQGAAWCSHQIARYLGANVIATASGRKAGCSEGAGSGHHDQLRGGGFRRPREIRTHRRGADVIFEHVRGETFERSLRCLAWARRLVTCGATSGAKPSINLSTFSLEANHCLARHGLKGGAARPADGVWFIRGSDRRVLPLDEIAEAHRALEAREVFSKVVLIP